MTLRRIKRVVKSIPVIGLGLVYLYRQMNRFKSSSEYWERRYRNGGNSGPGSYNRLAQFKAEFLNQFVSSYQVTSVIEWGCGDGAQLKLARYPTYTGIDVSPTAVSRCRGFFAYDPSKKFLTLHSVPRGSIADLSLSLDVIFHLVEDPVYESYMRDLFDSAGTFVIVYSSNLDLEWPHKHVRHRQFTRWVELQRPEWKLYSRLNNAYPYDARDPEQTSFADFFVFAKRHKNM